MEWKQLKMTVSTEQKEKHLQAVEKALQSRRNLKIDWAIPLTVLLTAVVLCFLIMVPRVSKQDVESSQLGQVSAIDGTFEKGYVYQGGLGKIPSSVLLYGVKRLSNEQLVIIEQLLENGKAVEVTEQLTEPIYEFGLMGTNEKQYVRMYYSSSFKGWIAHIVDENRWLEVENIDLFELVYKRESSPLRTVGILAFGLLAFGYMMYVEKVYMKDEEGRRRKSFAKLWHGVVAGSCYLIGFVYVVWTKGAFIPFGYVIGLSGLLLVAYLDRKNPEFMYRKYQYSGQILYLLFLITMFSFVNTY